MPAKCSGAGGLSLMADLVSGAGGPAIAIATVQAHITDSGGDPVPEATELDGNRRVAIACNECVRAKMRCSNERPCERCVRRACEHLCVDRPSRVAMVAPTPAVVIQTAVRRKRPRPVSFKSCNLCSKSNALCDLQRPCGRCIKLNEKLTCTDTSNNDIGSETESDDGEMLHEMMNGRHTPPSINTIVSPVATLPGLDPYAKSRTLVAPTLASPRNSPPPRSATVSPAPHHPQQSFVPFHERPVMNAGQNRNNRLLRGKPPFMVRSPLQFPLKLASQWRFAYKQHPATVLGPLLLSPTRMQHFMSNSLDVLSKEECIAMRVEMIIAACEKDASLSSQLIPLCTAPYNPIPFKTRCIALVLDSNVSIHEPFLTIGDDDLLRIAFWEAPCPVVRLAMSYEPDKTEISLSLSTEAQRILGFTSHAELDQLHQDFAKATSCPMSIPLLWRFFSQRSVYALGMALYERDFRNLTQFRVDLELVANNGLHIPCRTYWKFRMLPNGNINDILIAIKRIM